jgi:hypothetical protein
MRTAMAIPMIPGWMLELARRGMGKNGVKHREHTMVLREFGSWNEDGERKEGPSGGARQTKQGGSVARTDHA